MDGKDRYSILRHPGGPCLLHAAIPNICGDCLNECPIAHPLPINPSDSVDNITESVQAYVGYEKAIV
jgi:hypothetical protein